MSLVAEQGSVGAKTGAQLTLPISPIAGESLIGLVARATRLNVLGATSVVLEGAGLDLLHPGTIGQDIGTSKVLLANVLGCSLNDIEVRCHSYLDDPEGPQDIRWGSGALFRPDLIVEVRRVSPASLGVSNHHRAAWMNSLLPYCPESLELLVNTCSACGRKLGWRRAWGIDRCDKKGCKEPIGNSGEYLAQALSDGYRTFAKVVSPERAERDSALASLHADLHALPAAVLLSLILQMGNALAPWRLTLHRNTVRNLPPQTIAAIVVRGTRLLEDWPRGLREEVAKQSEEIGPSNGSARQTFINALRKLADRKNRPEQALLIRKAIPEAFEHLGVALGSLSAPVVSGKEACRLAGIDPSDIKSLRDQGLLSFRSAGGAGRLCAQYDKGEILELASALQGSIPASRLEQRLGLPRYALEQLICLSELEAEFHPGVAHLTRTLRLKARSVEHFSSKLLYAARQEQAPVGALRLGSALRLIGGRPKPWGAILSAMRKGELPFWLSDVRGKFARTASVLLSDIEPLLRTTFDEGDWPDFPFSDRLTQIDANDILNLDALQIQPVIAAGELTFTPAGVALMTKRAAVLELAQRMIAPSELAYLLQVDVRSVSRSLNRLYPEVRAIPGGWRRLDVLQALACRVT